MSYRMSVQTGAKSQPGLKRSSSKMELFRFFEEFKMWFMSIFDFCKTVVIHLKIEQTEIKPRCFFNPGWNVPSIIQDDSQPVNRDEIFSARVAWTSTRAETHPGPKFLSCNRLLCFNSILSFIGRAEISAREIGVKLSPGWKLSI